jgi:hypothetical protein
MLAAPGANPGFQSGQQPIGEFSSPDTQTGQFDPSKVTADPGYQFRIDQGLAGITAQPSGPAAFRWSAAKALNDYAQGLLRRSIKAAYGRDHSQAHSKTRASISRITVRISERSTRMRTRINRTSRMRCLVIARMPPTLSRTYRTSKTPLGRIMRWVWEPTRPTLMSVSNSKRINSTGWHRVAGYGQTAVNQFANSGNQAAQNVGSIQGQLGNAYAAGSAAQGNVWGNALNNLGNMGGQYMQYRGLQSPRGNSCPGHLLPYEDDYYYG